jgi:hypothetical protein
MLEEQKSLLIQYKNYCIRNPSLLPKYLLAVDWSVPEHVAEARRLLMQWVPVDVGNEVNLVLFCVTFIQYHAPRWYSTCSNTLIPGGYAPAFAWKI